MGWKYEFTINEFIDIIFLQVTNSFYITIVQNEIFGKEAYYFNYSFGVSFSLEWIFSK